MKNEICVDRNLKAFRKKAGLTRKELAQKISYTEKAVEKWEHGKSIPPLPVLCQVAEVLGVRLEELVYTSRCEIRYFLGIDGGGTKTAFLLEDAAGNLIAQCELGASNPNDIGMEQCAAVLRAGIREVAAGIDLQEVAVFAGLAGGISGNNGESIRKILSQLEFGFLAHGSDVDNALEVCLHGGNGVAVIAGTGNIAFVQEDGIRHRVGGWGYLLDTGGSGYSLGRDALDAACRALDGRGGATALSKLLEAQLQMPLEMAIPKIYSAGKRLIASLASAVFAACDQKDPVALAILDRNCAYLAELIGAAQRHITTPDAPVVICGGLANRADLLEPRIKEYCEKACNLHFCMTPMVSGAVMCARRNYAEYRKEK